VKEKEKQPYPANTQNSQGAKTLKTRGFPRKIQKRKKEEKISSDTMWETI
jgi:hypothetical protein